MSDNSELTSDDFGGVWYPGKFVSEAAGAVGERVAEGGIGGELQSVQNELRAVGVSALLRWGLFSSEVEEGRIEIPESELEKLGLDEGHRVQVLLTPLEGEE